MTRLLYTCCIILFLMGCSIIGIHPHIHNPKRAGKYPKSTQALALLGELRTARNCYDVQHYDLSVNFGDQMKDLGKVILGEVVMTAMAVQVTDSIQLDLHANMKIHELLYKSIGSESIENDNSKNWEAATYQRIENAIFVRIKRTLQKGQLFQIRISYSGAPPEAKRPPWRGGFVRKKDKMKYPWIGVACQSEGASLWWPCKDVMNDEPSSMDIRLTAPTGLTAVSNGQLADTSATTNSTTWHWKLTNPINVYNVTFYIGKLKLLHSTYASKATGQSLDLNHYVLDYNYQKAKLHFNQLENYLKFYEEKFGPYPWYTDGFKLVESPYAGMEHQSAIAYGNGYKNTYYGSIDYIILHETAHEWWGNSVTASDLAHAWLHEGFATYAEALYVEKLKGRDTYLDYIRFQRLTIINRRPIVGLEGLRYFNYKDGDIYMKGSWMLHTLRFALNNDSLFFDLIKSFYQQNVRKEINSQAFVDLVNAKTGVDYNWFFKQYLYNRFVPELEYVIQGTTLYYRWQKTAPDFILPVRVKGLKNGISILPKTNEVQQVEIDPSQFRIQDEYALIKPVKLKRVKELSK